MSDDVPDVTVLVPTRAAPERATSLRRAVGSILCQLDVRTRVIVMVNGASAEPELPPELRDDARVTILHHPAAHLPAAFRQGVSAVATPFFATLDDDDLLLPDGLKVRLAALARHPECAVVVTNGFRTHLGRDILHVTGEQRIQEDPLRELLRRNWLLPGSWLCRTTPATRAIFEAMPRHLECTYLGVRFAARGMIRVVEPTVG